MAEQFLNYDGLQEFKSLCDDAYSLPEVEFLQFYGHYEDVAGQSNEGWWPQFSNIQSVPIGSMFLLYINGAYERPDFSHGYDQSEIPVGYPDVSDAGVCSSTGAATGTAAGDRIGFNIKYMSHSNNYSERSWCLYRGCVYLCRKVADSYIDIYLIEDKLPYTPGRSIFVQDNNGGLSTQSWPDIRSSTNGSLSVKNGAIVIGPSIPTPTNANNGQILGVVNGQLKYVDMPTSTDLANVSEASF